MSLGQLFSQYTPIDQCGPESRYIIPGFLLFLEIDKAGGLTKFKMTGQRPITDDYVQSLCEQQTAFFQENGYFSVMRTQITIGHCDCDQCMNKDVVIDGQHRLSCLLRLFKEQPANFSLTEHSIDINYINSSHSKLRERFIVMAKNNQQISKMYIDDPKKHITEAVWEKFMVEDERFCERISKAKKSTKRPNVREIDFIDKFSNSKYLDQLIDEYDHNTDRIVNRWIEIFHQFNQYLANDGTYLEYTRDVTENMYETAFVSEFYLGLIPECDWVRLAYEYDFKQNAKRSIKKKPITIRLNVHK